MLSVKTRDQEMKSDSQRDSNSVLRNYFNRARYSRFLLSFCGFIDASFMRRGARRTGLRAYRWSSCCFRAWSVAHKIVRRLSIAVAVLVFGVCAAAAVGAPKDSSSVPRTTDHHAVRMWESPRDPQNLIRSRTPARSPSASSHTTPFATKYLDEIPRPERSQGVPFSRCASKGNTQFFILQIVLRESREAS